MNATASVTPFDLVERKRGHARVWVRSTTLVVSTASLIAAILGIIRLPWYFYAIMSVAVFAAAVAWEVADLITYCVNKKGIHPGAHVGVELILWLAMVVCTIFWGLTGAFYETYNYVTGSYTYGMDGLAIAAVTTQSLSTIFHFTLFVWACVDTDRRRKMRYAEMAAMINQTRMSMAPQNPYSYPPPPPGMVYQLASAPFPDTQPQPQPQPIPQAYTAQGNSMQQNPRYFQAPPQAFQQYDQRTLNSTGSPTQQQRVQSFSSAQTLTAPPQAYPRNSQPYAPQGQYSNAAEVGPGIPTPPVSEMSAKRY